MVVDVIEGLSDLHLDDRAVEHEMSSRIFAKGWAGSGLDEVEKLAVELLGVGRKQAVRPSEPDPQLGAVDKRRGQAGRGVDRDDLVVVAVDDEGRQVDPLEVFVEVALGELPDAVV